MKQVRKSGLRRLGQGGASGGTSSLPQAGRSTLLYVEDNKDNWEIAQLMLRLRFNMRWAQNDAEACKILKEESGTISAILMDIELKGSKLSGVDLVKLIRGSLNPGELPPFAREVPTLAEIPIIFLTGYVAKYSETELIAIGGNRALNKPVNFAELSMALSSLAVSTISSPVQASRNAARSEMRFTQLLTDNPRFPQRLMSLAEAGLFAPPGFKGDIGTLTTSLGSTGMTYASLALSIMDIVEKANEATDFIMALVLRRAVAASLLAKHSGLVDPNLAAATGFILDAGLLVRALHDAAGALEIGMSPAVSRPRRERAANEVEHTARIIEVTRNWGLAPDIVTAVEQHHAEQMPTEPLARITWAAERLAAVFETGSLADTSATAIAAGKALGLPSRTVEEVLEEIPTVVGRLGQSVGVRIAEQMPYRALMQQSSSALAALGRSYRELESTSLALLEEKNALTDRLSEAKERVAAAYKKDMALLAAVQSMFLPAQGRVSNARLEVASFYRSADDCGGDWWWWEENDEGFRILVGDVSGHGSGAAMVTGALASVARLAAKNPALHAPTQLLRVMHEELAAIAKGAYHMTMALLDIPRAGGVATLYSAAAPHLLRLGPDGKIGVAPLRGTPLGLAQNEPQIGKAELQIPAGTRLFLFTDGVYEFETANGVTVGVQMLRRALTATAGMNTDQACKKIVDTITELHPDDVPQADDMTFVIIDVK